MATKGYNEIWIPSHPYAKHNGCILEQRYIAEKMIGRFLKPSEVVHHKDGNKQNNSESNLMIFKDSKSHNIYHSGNYSNLLYNNGIYECIVYENKCLECKKILNNNRKKICSIECKNMFSRKVKHRPTREELLNLLSCNSFVKVGKMYGVSDNTIRKWIKEKQQH